MFCDVICCAERRVAEFGEEAHFFSHVFPRMWFHLVCSAERKETALSYAMEMGTLPEKKVQIIRRKLMVALFCFPPPPKLFLEN